MTVFPNYIYQNILDSIISFIYNNDSILAFDQYDINYNKETINYSIVCKSWFEMIKLRILPNQFDHWNYNVLKYLMEKEDSSENLPPSPFKLVKISDSTKVYSLSSYLEESPSTINRFKKVIIDIYSNKDSCKVLDTIESFPKNVEINLSFKVKNFQIYSKNSNLNNNNNNNNNNNEITKHNDKIKYLSVDSLEFKKSEISLLLETNVLQKHYSVDNKDSINIGINFGAKNIKETLIYNILFPVESLKYNNTGNYTLPSHSVPKENLEKFHLDKIGVHDLIDLKKVEKNSHGSIITKATEDDIKEFGKRWTHIINRLSKDSTIRTFFLKHRCKKVCKCADEGIDIESFYKGLKQLFSSDVINFHYMELVCDLELNKHLVEGLAKNKSFRDFDFNCKHFSNIITNILPYNRSIRNLFLNTRGSIENSLYYTAGNQDIVKELKHQNYLDISNGLLLLSKYQNSIDIYSITIEVCFDEQDFKELIELIKDNKYPVREFFLINEPDFFQNERTKAYSNTIYSNGSFIDVIDHKKKEGKVNSDSEEDDDDSEEYDDSEEDTDEDYEEDTDEETQ